MTFSEPSHGPIDVLADSPYGAPKSRRIQIQVIATLAVLVAAVVAVTVAVVGGPSGTRVSNAKLLRLIHASANSANRSPSTTMHLRISVSAAGQHGQMQMNGIESRSNREASISLTGLGQSLRVLTINHTVYESVADAGRAANNNKPWIALRAPQPTPEEQALQSQGPAAYLKVLANVDGRIYDDGQQTVRGVRTTKYSLRVDVFSLLGPTFRQLFPSVTEDQIKQTGLDNLPMSLWLDRSGLTREMQIAFTVRSVSINEIMYLEPSQQVAHLMAPPVSQVNVVHSLTQLGRVLRASEAS